MSRPTDTKSNTKLAQHSEHQNSGDSADFASQKPSSFWLLQASKLSQKASLPALGGLFEAGKCLGLQDPCVRHGVDCFLKVGKFVSKIPIFCG